MRDASWDLRESLNWLLIVAQKRTNCPLFSWTHSPVKWLANSCLLLGRGAIQGHARCFTHIISFHPGDSHVVRMMTCIHTAACHDLEGCRRREPAAHQPKFYDTAVKGCGDTEQFPCSGYLDACTVLNEGMLDWILQDEKLIRQRKGKCQAEGTTCAKA